MYLTTNVWEFFISPLSVLLWDPTAAAWHSCTQPDLSSTSGKAFSRRSFPSGRCFCPSSWASISLQHTSSSSAFGLTPLGKGFQGCGLCCQLPSLSPFKHITNTQIGGTKSRKKVLKCWIPKLLFLWQHTALNRSEVFLSYLFSPLGIKASYKSLLRRRHPCCRCLKMVRQIQL